MKVPQGMDKLTTATATKNQIHALQQHSSFSTNGRYPSQPKHHQDDKHDWHQCRIDQRETGQRRSR